MRGGEILPCHAKMAFLFIILCFSHDLFFSVLIQLQVLLAFVRCQIDFGGSNGRQSFDWVRGLRENKFSAHFPFPDGEIIFTFEHTNYAGETLTLNTFFSPPIWKSLSNDTTSNWQMPRSSILEQLFRCFFHKCHDLFIQAIKNERMSRAIMQRVAQKINHLPILILSVLRRREKQIKFTESSRIPSPNPDSINGWTWRSAKVTKSSVSSPPFLAVEIFDHNTSRYTLSRATAGKRGETKKIFRSTFARASSWLSWGDYYVLDWKNSH